MQVPRLMAPGLTLGAALSNSTRERPCASLPVTTRRIGFIPAGMAFLPGSEFVYIAPGSTKGRCRMDKRLLRRGRTAAVIAISAVLWWMSPSFAQEQNFPNRPVRIIVGPSPDVLARIVAEHLQEAWGQPVVVEPRPGGGGKIAVSSVTSAAPDGHTLLFATPTFTLATAMKLATHDFAKDLDPAALIGLIAYALVVNPTVPANSVADLVALAK